MLKNIVRRSYVYVLLVVFYVPLFVGAVFSFSRGVKRGDMPVNFSYSHEGWLRLQNDNDIVIAILNSLFIALLVAIIVVTIGLVTVFGLWRQRNKTVKGFVSLTSNIPLINPDVITAISLAIAFAAMFGVLQGRDDTGYWRLIFAQVTMILPYAITIMYPRSEKFRISLMEASKDLGYGPIRTWFRTYFRHMVPVAVASLGVAIALSLDDFIITRIVSREDTVGKLMYQGSLDPWVLALGTIMLAVALGSTVAIGAFASIKSRRKKVGA